MAPGDAPENLRQSTKSEITRLAAAEGLTLEVQETLEPEDLTPDTRIVIFISRTAGGEPGKDDPGDEARLLTDLAGGRRSIQFLGIGVPGLTATDNISVINIETSSPSYLGFLAGYTAAVVTDEWRVGVIATNDPRGEASREGFLNGVVFFCGLCQPTYPPFSGYPLAVSLPQSSTQIEWQAAADTLIDRAVKTIFVAPGAGDAALVEYLAQSGLAVIGTSTPPPGTESQWVATISTDITPLLESIWAELIAGHGGLSSSLQIQLTEINPQLLSPGRQRLIEELIGEVQGGFIDPGVEGGLPAP